MMRRDVLTLKVARRVDGEYCFERRVSMPDQQNKCAHTACTCQAAAGSKYCSPYCESAKDRSEISCGCGHEACGSKAL